MLSLRSRKPKLTTVGDSLRWPRDTLSPLKLVLTSPTSGSRSVGIVRSCGLKPRIFFLFPSFLPSPRRYSSGWALASWTICLHFWFLNNLVFMVWGCYPHVQPPTCRTRVFLFVWLLPLELSGMGDSTSSYATALLLLHYSSLCIQKFSVLYISFMPTGTNRWPHLRTVSRKN
jgi:hypothetical protein